MKKRKGVFNVTFPPFFLGLEVKEIVCVCVHVSNGSLNWSNFQGYVSLLNINAVTSQLESMDNNLDENNITFYVSSFVSGLEISEYVQDAELIKS